LKKGTGGLLAAGGTQELLNASKQVTEAFNAAE
jgi:hypothetical protein